MIRAFCDCCGDEITASNDPACGNKGLGRLTAQVMPKMGGAGEVMAVEVITAHEGTWNKGHFCKYCVIDAINKLDDRTALDPGYQERTELLNLRLDLLRLLRDEPTLCGFPEVAQIKALLATSTGGTNGS